MEFRTLQGDFSADQRLKVISHLSGETLTKIPQNAEELESLLPELGRYKLYILAVYYTIFNIGRVSGNNFTQNIGKFDWLKYISDPSAYRRRS